MIRTALKDGRRHTYDANNTEGGRSINKVRSLYGVDPATTTAVAHRRCAVKVEKRLLRRSRSSSDNACPAGVQELFTYTKR